MSSVPLTRGWWRSLTPARRLGYRQLLPYLIGGLIAYLFVVLGSHWPARIKWLDMALLLVVPVWAIALGRALALWPRRRWLVVWMGGLAVVVPFAWLAGGSGTDRVAKVLGVVVGWSVVLPLIIRRLRDDGSWDQRQEQPRTAVWRQQRTLG